MSPINEMNEQLPPIATGLPYDDPDFMNHRDRDVFEALGIDLRGRVPGCDGLDVDQCKFQCGECERNCPHE